ncbi:SoxR reducing system RseC family protein [Anoxybacterium hadale]|uniref:SoxR reducing system RseC family protein n=1 Tax=Anoxybacterium hadale TaxID=3408580 RepID=A0ACD1AAI7_9FIRM|nr:SoxR reducing system RseC family protein [Clostridiales bacterium]
MKKMADVLDVIDQSTAKVMLYKHKKCSGCGSCNKHMHPGSIVDAFNPVGAQKGDMVDVNVIKKFSIKEFLVGYVLPVASFFAGLLLGGMLFPGMNGGGFTVILAFFLLAVSIAVNVRYRRSFKPEYSVTIIKRIAPAEPRL